MTDLTDRMRTCAAYIASRPNDAPMPTEHLLDDAADLLIEASNGIDAIPPPLGEPMAIIPPVATTTVTKKTDWSLDTQGTWIAPGGALPTAQPGARSPRACPKCDSHAAKRVRREGTKLMLVCPACSATWEWKR